MSVFRAWGCGIRASGSMGFIGFIIELVGFVGVLGLGFLTFRVNPTLKIIRT